MVSQNVPEHTWVKVRNPNCWRRDAGWHEPEHALRARDEIQDVLDQPGAAE
ncbi:MAG: hypothetical protein WD380_11405 [Gaiellaceae bacterium]